MGCVPRRVVNLSPRLLRAERFRHPRVLELQRPDFCAQLPSFSNEPSRNTAFEVCGREAASCEYQVDAETTVGGGVDQDALDLYQGLNNVCTMIRQVCVAFTELLM